MIRSISFGYAVGANSTRAPRDADEGDCAKQARHPKTDAQTPGGRGGGQICHRIRPDRGRMWMNFGSRTRPRATHSPRSHHATPVSPIRVQLRGLQGRFRADSWAIPLTSRPMFRPPSPRSTVCRTSPEPQPHSKIIIIPPPRLARIRPTSDKFGRVRPEVLGHDLADSGPYPADSGRSWPQFGRTRPEFGRDQSLFGRFRANPPEIGGNLSNIGRTRRTLSQIWPRSAEFAPNLAELIWTSEFGQI